MVGRLSAQEVARGLWPRKLSGASGSGGRNEVRGLWGCQDVRGSGGHQDFRSPRGGQGAKGSGDLVQEVQEVIVISGAQWVARGLWGQ